MKELVGQVSQEEMEIIKSLFERKNGLLELSKILMPENELLYEKLVKDMGDTSMKFQKWWDEKSNKYGWKSKAGYAWEIDFDTCNIYLKKEEHL